MADILFALGHGPDKNKKFDPGASGNGTTEAAWLRGVFLTSLKKYAGGKIDFYEQNMFANRDANTIKAYKEVVELHLDAASPAAKGGHVIIYKGYKPDALDTRLGNTIKKHFGLRGGVMFSGRNDLYNLNVFTKRKITYRLLELGFITNAENMAYFKKNYDAIAKDLIEDVLGKQAIPTPKPTPVKPAAPKPAPKTRFSDVPKTHPHYDAIERVAKAGIIEGHTNGTYQPDEPVTRAHVAVMLDRALKLKG